MKSIFKKLLIAIPVIYLALFIGLWSSVTDTRPMIGLLDKIRSDSATEIVDFSSDDEKPSKAKPKPNKDRNPYYGDLHVHTKHSLMPIFLELQQHLTMHIDTPKRGDYASHGV